MLMKRIMLNALVVALSLRGIAVAAEVVFSPNQGVVVPRRRLAPRVAFPVQTFFIPLPEEALFKDGFYQINPEKARPGVVSLISVATSTDNTIIWYDHWEDGYDSDVSNNTARTTEVWGDGLASNGCAPDVSSCTDQADVVNAGRAIVIQNTVALPRDRSKILYDGGDRIQASFPVAITRGAYPVAPGSLMAGAVEVLELRDWDVTFEAPLGMDIGKYFEAFQLSAFFFMAAYDGTKVFLPNGSMQILNMGETGMVRVNQGDRLLASNALQVDLITGDVWSYYEMRWYSLFGKESWHNQYVSPMGDTVGKTKVLLYNGNDQQLDISIDYLDGGTTKKTVVTTVSPRKAVLSHVIPTGSGAWFNATKNFIALSLTDTEFTTSTGQKTGSQWYDWGFPVMPRDLLTSQVLIGWGYGCTDNKCYGQEDRSVVWVTAVKDADIFVDYQNLGRDYVTHQLRALGSIKIRDTRDQDMSGAVVFATERGSGPDGPPVDIAACWGQDPAVSEAYQSISMDLGTVVVPFTLVRVMKKVNKELVKPGETLTYTIRIINVGNKILKSGTMTLYDQLDDHVSYVNESSFSGLTGSLMPLPDNLQSSTRFPLDENGHLMRVTIERRGGSYDIEFNVVVDKYEKITNARVENAGRLVTGSGIVYPYRALSMVDFGANIDIVNTVYLGHDQGVSCGTGKDVEKVQGDFGDAVTYCLKVTNSGFSKLGSVQVVDEVLQYINTSIGSMNPGASVMLKIEKTVTGTITNIATATGNPLFFDGSDIPDLPDVSDSDPSAIDKIDHSPNIQVENTVYKGNDKGAKCDTDVPQEKVYGVVGSDVVYCFRVTNIGDTHLDNIVLNNADLSFKDSSIGRLAPGAKATVYYQTTISTNLVNNVVVLGNPVLPDGQDLVGVDDVMDNDPSEVIQNVANPSVEIVNRVYLGDDRGASCDSDKPVDLVQGFRNDALVYCFKITNKGDTHLSNVKVKDEELNFSNDSSIGILAPGQSTTLAFWAPLNANLTNYATVTANPSTSNGLDMVGYEDVTDVDPSEVVMLSYGAEIDVQNTVYLGHDGGISCSSERAKERETGYRGTDITYCFVVTNSGKTYLKNIAIVNGQLKFQNGSIGPLAPGAAATVYHESSIENPIVNYVNVTAMPSDKNGGNLPGATQVTDSDPSEVGELQRSASIEVLNTVYAGNDDGNSCQSDLPLEQVTDYVDTQVVYCFRIANRGDVHLKLIRISNAALSFDDSTSLRSLAPGAFLFVYVAGKITATSSNTVTVVANPVTENGIDIPGIPDVTASDPSSVVLKHVVAGVSVENTVYSGHNNGASCGTTIPTEVAEGYSGTNVTYCFMIRNTGETYLSGIKIRDGELFFEDESLLLLAPNATAYVSFQSKITTDLINTAFVIAQPARQSGVVISGSSEVKDDDPSQVKVTKIRPGVSISNTVYSGPHDNGVSCGGVRAVKKISAYQGDEITYCFKIVNTGDVYLGSITIDNTELSFVDHSVGLLAPNALVTVPFQTRLIKSHVNTATVTATPSTPKGNDILGAKNVQASDPSEVEKLEYLNGISVENTVYYGHNGGSSCNNSTAKNVEGFAGTKITYCFKIINIGKTYLGDIAVDNVDLEYYNDGKAIGRLAPGNYTMIAVSKLIVDNLKNVVRVKASPVSAEGIVLVGTGHVADEDDSSVAKKAHSPSVEIDNKVYMGTDGGSSCDKAQEKVIGYQGDYVTFCFTVKNTGNTHLNSITVHNSHLSFTDFSIGLLAPGQSRVVVFAGVITGDERNVVQVAANPVTPSQEDIIGSEDVSDSDPSEVETINANPRISITNKVYLGDDKGSKCGTDVPTKRAEGYYGYAVVYCLMVQNTGDTYLSDVVINDIGLDFFDDKTIGTLAPSQVITVVVSSFIEKSLENTADVTANPVTPGGVEITGVDDVADSDSSSVAKLEHDASILIENTVYVGHDRGRSCGTSGATSRAAGFNGTDVTYCFKVTNTGETHLGVVTIEDKVLSFYDSSIGTLAPGKSATVYAESQIKKDLRNVAVVTANPISQDGSDLRGTDDVEDRDPSEVGVLEHRPSIRIENTVYSGNDGGESCDTEIPVEMLKTYKGDEITYCLVVTNTGNTPLNRVVLVDPALSFRDATTFGLMAPGVKKIIPVIRNADRDLSNTAVVTATPVTVTGDRINGASDLTASDPSSVALLVARPTIAIDNKVYLGQDEGDSCGTNIPVERVEGYFGHGVVFCMTITNTGDTYLDSVTITNSELDFYDNDSVGMLAPGETKVVPVARTIDGSAINVAVVAAAAVSPTGTPIKDISEVTDSDPSEVSQLKYDASVLIENTVYVGDNGGESCITDIPKERVTDFVGSTVTYCFKVTNTGTTYLNHIRVSNPALSFTDLTIPMLPPGASEIIYTKGVIAGSLENIVSVIANPVSKKGDDLEGADDVSDSDPSFVDELSRAPRIKVSNTVYASHDKGASCPGTEKVIGMLGDRVTYCFKVQNTGNTYLTNIELQNTELSFVDKVSIGLLAPGQTSLVHVEANLRVDLTNTVKVQGKPADSTGVQIGEGGAVMDSDSSEVSVLTGALTASIKIENTVYVGKDFGSQCATAGEIARGQKEDQIIYCYKVKNTGQSYLADILIATDVAEAPDNSIGILSPGASEIVRFISKISGNFTNTANVTASPVRGDGTMIPGMAKVVDSDPSQVIAYIKGDTKFGDKDLYKPPSGPGKCMQNNYQESGNDEELICAAREVYVVAVESNIASCVQGSKISIDVIATMQISSHRYDVGWYIATDGGDSLTGTCVLNGFQNGTSLSVVDGPTSDQQIGYVSWKDDVNGPSDSCGDVIMGPGDNGFVELPILVGTPIACTDADKDGSLDFSVCFTWRTDTTDDQCNLVDAKTVVPGAADACFCTRYNLPNVTVDDGPFVEPCR